MIQTEKRRRKRSYSNGARPRAAAHSPIAAAPSVGELDPRRWPALVVVLTASFLGVLDFFIVNVSIPAIKDGLQATNAAVELMIASYGLAYAVLLITGGRLGDILGRKRMFLIGVAGFTVASACCGLATTPAVLIASRVFQGMTAALLFPQGLSIIQVSFPAHERALAFGAMGMVSGAAMFSGNILGGLLVDANLLGLGWRPIFLVNVPIGVLALLAAWPLLRESRSPKASRLDLGGVALGSLGLFLLVYPLAEGRDAGWPLWAFVVCLALSALTLAAFLWYERRVSAAGGSPLVEIGLFRDRLFVDGLLTTLIFYGGLSAFFLSFTLFLQNGMGLTPRAAGFVFTPFAIGFGVSSTVCVRLARWLGSRLIQIGAVLMAAALTAVVVLAYVRGASLSCWEMVPALLVYGMGQGCVIPTLLRAVLSGVHSHDAGSASGVLATVQQVSLAVGVAVIGSVYFAALGPGRGEADFLRAVETALLVNLGLLATTFVLAFRLPRRLAGDVPEAAAMEM